MEDKEVGELWTRVQFSERDGDGDWLHKRIVQSVIRKLVEERAHGYLGGVYMTQCSDIADGWSLALRDFGIDPKTWPK